MGAYEDLTKCFGQIQKYKAKLEKAIPEFGNKAGLISAHFERMLQISIKQFDSNVEEVILNQKRLFAETQKMTEDLEKKQ